jgi:hypothetical protein
VDGAPVGENVVDLPVGALFGQQAQYPIAVRLVVRYEIGDRTLDIGGGAAKRSASSAAERSSIAAATHVVTAAEMAQDGALGDAGPGGDLGKGRARIADLQGRLQDGVARTGDLLRATTHAIRAGVSLRGRGHLLSYMTANDMQPRMKKGAD